MDNVFRPSAGVNIVLNMNSLSPHSRTSIIYDIDPTRKEITIAQPLTPFSKNTRFKDLTITTTVHDKNRERRVGVECVQFRVIDKYRLTGKTEVAAVVLKYELPVKECNIRSAYRLPLSKKFTVKGKIFFNKMTYSTPRDFSIWDISQIGLGLKIPKKRDDKTNALSSLKKNEEIAIELILIKMSQDQPEGTFTVRTKIARIKSNYSSTHSLMGVEMIDLKTNSENILNKFMHDAQVDELKRLKRKRRKS